jgi:cyclase
VRTLVNTHHHGDHTYGNYLFPEATIVAQERCRREVLRGGLPHSHGVWTGPDWGAIEFVPTFVTFSEGVDLYVDDLRCEVRYVGVGTHTTNESVVWVPEQSVLFSGDVLFNGGTPFVLGGVAVGGGGCRGGSSPVRRPDDRARSRQGARSRGH